MSKKPYPSKTSPTELLDYEWDSQCMDFSSESSSSKQSLSPDTPKIDPPQRKKYSCEFIHISRAQLSENVERVDPPNEPYAFIVLDMEYFEPHEIEAKVLGDYLLITAKQDEKQDAYGCVSRQFIMKSLLPSECDSQRLLCKLSSDGFLTIIAPKKQPQGEVERTVQIQCTGKPLIFTQQDDPEND